MIVKGRGAQLEVARIQSEINRLFETLLRLRDGEGASSETWSPSVDVAECSDHLLVEIEVPGIDPETLELASRSDQLIVRGCRQGALQARGVSAEVIHDEREFGAFERSIALPVPVNTHKADARLEAGVLTVTFPKVPNRRGEAVPIPIKKG